MCMTALFHTDFRSRIIIRKWHCNTYSTFLRKILTIPIIKKNIFFSYLSVFRYCSFYSSYNSIRKKHFSPVFTYGNPVHFIFVILVYNTFQLMIFIFFNNKLHTQTSVYHPFTDPAITPLIIYFCINI